MALLLSFFQYHDKVHSWITRYVKLGLEKPFANKLNLKNCELVVVDPEQFIFP